MAANLEEAEADAAEIYAAVKPSGREPEWDGPLLQLMPTLPPVSAPCSALDGQPGAPAGAARCPLTFGSLHVTIK